MAADARNAQQPRAVAIGAYRLGTVDEYQHEIDQLQAQVDAMVEAEDDLKEIAELQMQLDILRAIYGQAARLYEAGRRTEELRYALTIRGYGEWTLDNVYSFVYEAAVDLPSEGHGFFLGEIRDTDFAALLWRRSGPTDPSDLSA